MKNLKALLFTLVLFVTLGINAQKKQEKKAKKIATEMTKVLDLTKKESKAVYKIHLDKFNASTAIKKQFANEPEVKKQNLKKLGNSVYNQMKDALGGKEKGKARLEEWKQYKQSKK
jgi:type III secretory pathway component EscR